MAPNPFKFTAVEEARAPARPSHVIIDDPLKEPEPQPMTIEIPPGAPWDQPSGDPVADIKQTIARLEAELDKARPPVPPPPGAWTARLKRQVARALGRSVADPPGIVHIPDPPQRPAQVGKKTRSFETRPAPPPDGAWLFVAKGNRALRRNQARVNRRAK